MSRLQEAKDLLAATEGHTPAPWSLQENALCEQWDAVLYDEKERVERRIAQDISDRADAALIAAAPALRELLAAMVAEVERLRFEAAGHELYSCHKCNFISYVQGCCFQCRALEAEAELKRIRLGLSELGGDA